ncbi:hypothetical protein BH20ACT3_BH20ACT3_14990 [soil metagenome]
MSDRSADADVPWRHRRTPSLVAFVVVLAVVGLATVSVAGQVADVLPEVGRDQLGEDRWENPLGVELVDDVQVGHVPDCAAGPVTRIALWDADSNPYWEVTAPPTDLDSFYVGVAPEGFTEETAYTEPPPGEVVRLVVFHRTGGVAGLRYTRAELRRDRLVSGRPLSRFTVSGFKEAAVCGQGSDVTVPTDTEPVPDLGPTEEPVPDGGGPEAPDDTGPQATQPADAPDGGGPEAPDDTGPEATQPADAPGG